MTPLSNLQQNIQNFFSRGGDNDTTPKKGAVIFLHGLGDTPNGWTEELKYNLPRHFPALKDIAYVLPAAPTIRVTSSQNMPMPAWFDLYDYPIKIGSQDDKERMLQAVATVEQEVEKLAARGIPPSKIVVAGFSQGGVIATLAAYRRHQEPFAGAANLAGWLALPDELEVSDAAKKTPMFWGHGRVDTIVPLNQQEFGVNKLREQGVQVQDKVYFVTHSVHRDELKDFAEFVHQNIFTGDDEKEEGKKHETEEAGENKQEAEEADAEKNNSTEETPTTATNTENSSAEETPASTAPPTKRRSSILFPGKNFLRDMMGRFNRSDQ